MKAKPQVQAAQLWAHRLTQTGKWVGREAVEDTGSSPRALEEKTLSASRQGSPSDCGGDVWGSSGQLTSTALHGQPREDPEEHRLAQG